ncbi:TetR/AcrR family transcriptional regulator [Aquabacterium sp. J223]|uniref:TetR/AcrR family transcriptional regulator n=1 Tax=Aquabacterium sp. J223 TaxID=2898431 RepID=UPI0021ADB16D|nr:TetR/AcrR family transcriptional regulator [Aquabacterium sp. J223]UUX95963.1 TetR/AcrR family transcriptional regulator [Aquabacterium sp. J223]
MDQTQPPRAAAQAGGGSVADGGRPWGGRIVSPQAQRELKEEAVLECAALWFLRHGFHGASLSDIARDLGLTKPALYHYARNKEELLYKLHVRSLMAAKRARDEAVGTPGTGLDRLARLVRNVVMIMTGSPVQTFMAMEPGTLTPQHAQEVAQALHWLSHDLRALVAAGVADGSITACDPKLTTFIIIGAQNWVARWYRAGGEWDREHIADAYADMVRRMLRPDPAG